MLRTVVLCLCVVHVSRTRAVLRFALLRFASRTALGVPSFIHSHASLEGGYACGCVARVRIVRECARVQRALGVCAVVHVVTHSFSARGEVSASESVGGGRQMPHPNPEGRHAPTAGGPHIHPHSLYSPSSTNHSGGES